ncbi:hypothetical protein R80B4_02231 [Fibrobacteres bacterium R8-0-B4]
MILDDLINGVTDYLGYAAATIAFVLISQIRKLPWILDKMFAKHQTKGQILRHLDTKPGGFKISELITDVFNGCEPCDLKQALTELEAGGYIRDVPFSHQEPFYYIQKPKGMRGKTPKKAKSKTAVAAVVLIAVVTAATAIAVWYSRTATASEADSDHEPSTESEEDGSEYETALESDDDCAHDGTESEEDGDARETETDGAFKTVQIGEQTWMAENLNYNIGNSWCYDNKRSSCEKYGRLYDWNTALSACPTGWHLPTFEEWMQLVEYIGQSNGKQLRSASGWDVNDYYNGNGTDDFGFSALPGGYRSDLGGGAIGFGLAVSCGNWWTATAESKKYITNILMCSLNDDVREHYSTANYGCSVRCIMN